jgi:hypothetical protein
MNSVNVLRRAAIGWPLLVLLAAFMLRTAGVAWGQPDVHYAPSSVPFGRIDMQTPLHPDEFLFVALPLKMLYRDTLDPQFYENPSFLLNLNYLTSRLSGLHQQYPAVGIGGSNDREIAPFSAYVVGRVYSALGGMLAVAAAFAAGRLLAGYSAGLWAMLLCAVSLPLVQHAHYATTSSLAAGFAALCAVLCMRAVGRTARPVPWLAAAAVCAGLAAGNRYNAGLVAVCVLLAGLYVLWVRDEMRQPRRLLCMALVWALVPAAFLFTTPGAIFVSEKFLRDLRYISNQYLGGPTAAISAWQGLLEELWYLVVFGIGVLGVVLALAGMWRAARGARVQRAQLWLLLAFVALHLLLINRTVRPNIADQLILPVIPPLAVLAGAGMAALRLRGGLLLLAGALLIGQPLYQTVTVLARIQTPDTRTLAQAWLSDRLPAGARVLRVGSINVPLDPAFVFADQVFDLPQNVDWARYSGYDYLVISDALADRYAQTGLAIRSSLPEGAVAIATFSYNGPSPVGTSLVYSAAYYHQPTLRLYCLNAPACNATMPARGD